MTPTESVGVLRIITEIHLADGGSMTLTLPWPLRRKDAERIHRVVDFILSAAEHGEFINQIQIQEVADSE